MLKKNPSKGNLFVGQKKIIFFDKIHESLIKNSILKNKDYFKAQKYENKFFLMYRHQLISNISQDTLRDTGLKILMDLSHSFVPKNSPSLLKTNYAKPEKNEKEKKTLKLNDWKTY